MNRYAVIENGTVTNIAVAEEPIANNWIEAADADLGYLWDGTGFSPPPPPTLTFEEAKRMIVDGAQIRLDAFAKTRDYDGILSLTTYATSTVPEYQIEGQRGVEARDATWNAVYTILSEIETEVRPMPSAFSDIENDLPALSWPESTQ